MRAYLGFVAGASVSALVFEGAGLSAICGGSNLGAATVIWLAPLPAALVVFVVMRLGPDEWPVWKTTRASLALIAYVGWLPWPNYLGFTPHPSAGHGLTIDDPTFGPARQALWFVIVAFVIAGPITAFAAHRALKRLERRQMKAERSAPPALVWATFAEIAAVGAGGAIVSGFFILILEIGAPPVVWFAPVFGMYAWGSQHLLFALHATDTARLAKEVRHGLAWLALPLLVLVGVTVFALAALGSAPRGAPVVVYWDRFLVLAAWGPLALVTTALLWVRASRVRRAVEATSFFGRPLPPLPPQPPMPPGSTP